VCVAYAFLDPNKEHGLLAAYILGIGLAAIIVFSLARSLVHLRARAVASLVASARLRKRTVDVPEGSEGGSPIVRDAPVVRRIKAGGRWSWKRDSRAQAAAVDEEKPRPAEALDEWETVDGARAV
jgi:hypothetical protein